MDYNDKSEVIAFDIKDIVLITYIIDTIKRLLYIVEALPTRLFDFLNPILNSCFGLGMKVCVIFQWFLSKYPHISYRVTVLQN